MLPLEKFMNLLLDIVPIVQLICNWLEKLYQQGQIVSDLVGNSGTFLLWSLTAMVGPNDQSSSSNWQGQSALKLKFAFYPACYCLQQAPLL
jgi:hypothetical protein